MQLGVFLISTALSSRTSFPFFLFVYLIFSAKVSAVALNGSMVESMEPWLLSRFLDSHHLTHLLSHTIVGFILPLQQQNEISIVFSPCPAPWSYIFLSSGKWQIPLQNIIWRWLWQYWLWCFQWRDTKLERFLAKN